MLRLARLSGGVALLVMLWSVPAGAHAGGAWYDNDGGAAARFPWDSSSDTIYAFSSGSTWPSGWKDAIDFADDRWDNVLESSLFSSLSQEEPFPGTSCANDFNGQQIIRRGEALDNAMARTVICLNTSTGAYGRWFITIDPSFTWYSGTGQAPSDQQHLRGVMTHEFGHATGFGTGSNDEGHFVETDDSTCPSSASLRDTMCVNWGTTFEDFQNEMTSLEDHDKHTFLNIY